MVQFLSLIFTKGGGLKGKRINPMTVTILFDPKNPIN